MSKAVRKAKWMKVGLSLKALAQWAEEAVLSAAREQADNGGQERAAYAVAALAQKVDDAINPPNPIAEAASDAAIYASRIILAAIIEGAFSRLRAQGRA